MTVIEKENLIRNKKIMTKKETKFKKIGTGQMPIDVVALKKMRQPGYHQINRGLTLDATPTDRAKYEIQQNILGFVQDNNISDQNLKKILEIKEKKRLECLLFAHIENFSLDELFAYAEKLTIPLRVINEKDTLASHKNSNGRTRKHA